MRTTRLVTSLLLVAWLGAAESDPLRGADAILAEMAKPVMTPVAAPADARPSRVEVERLAADPQRTAEAWLALAARWSGTRSDTSAQAEQLLAALPAPATWPAIRAGLTTLAERAGGGDKAKRRAAGWRLVAAALTPDRAIREEALTAARATLDENDDWTLRAANDLIVDSEQDPQALVQSVERQLVTAATEKSPSITLPDLVAAVGEERALPVVRSALALPFSDLQINGTRTRTLAVREALARIETMKSAPWSLIRDADSLALFEALEVKFPAPAKRDRSHYERRQAESAYLAQLIAAGRTTAALARVEKAGKRGDELLSDLPLEQLLESRPAELTDLVRDLLIKQPERPLWGLYTKLAAQLGRADEIKRMVHDHGAAAVTQEQLIDLLLAADDLEPALVAIRSKLKAAPEAAPKQADPAKIDEDEDEETSWKPTQGAQAQAFKLLELGAALARPELIAEACAAYERLPATAPRSWGNESWQRTAIMLAAGRGGLAERLLQAELALPAANRWEKDRPATLSALVRLYVAAQRPADAVTILTKADQWGATDLTEVADGSDAHEGIPPLAAIAGQALAAVGKTAEARACALLALDQEPTSDAGYALLRQLDGAKAKPVFEQLQRRDRLEERPLIWLAQLALDAGATAEAEALARASMQADPSDGDQGPGDRMRGRAILAEALEKLGRAEEAKPLRTAVSAIRQGEQGDILLRAGLSVRATVAYLASEQILDRTYCVQSRLAVTLAKLGRNAEAAVHFRRAFELMPKAFGRRESHCFGCEGVFGGTDARKIAEEVFTGLVAKDAANPKHQYLLGYLRSEQERYPEAAAAFRAAIARDPEYDSALRHLLKLDDELRLPRTERQDLTLALVRLDPGNRHGGWEVAHVLDLAALYDVLLAHAPDLTVAPEQVLPLTQPTPDPANGNGDMFGSYRTIHGRERHASAGAALAGHPLLQAAASLIDRDW